MFTSATFVGIDGTDLGAGSDVSTPFAPEAVKGYLGDHIERYAVCE